MHAYPEDLARLVRNQWTKPPDPEGLIELPAYSGPDKLPPLPVLDDLLSICYQASLLRDEDRPVRFRILLRGPDRFGPHSGSANGLQALPFQVPLPLTANELRRLAPASPLERSLIGVRRSGRTSRLEIWGLVHSGQRWLLALEGLRREFTPLPPSLVVSVAAPGHLAVAKGSLTVARLLRGRLATPAPGVLEIADVRKEEDRLEVGLLAQLNADLPKTGAAVASISLPLLRRIRRLVALRIVSGIRRLQHGGAVLVLPPEIARNPKRYAHVLRIKYSFGPGNSRARLGHLTLRLLKALALECGSRFGGGYTVTWKDYLASAEPAVIEADEAITEFAGHIACLSAVDGAVVIGQPLELLGFGAEVSGQLPPVDQVARAVDSRFRRLEMESTLNVGTRHRSTYRFCRALPGVSALLVSQDGSVQFVACLDGRVVYTEHLSSGALNV